LAQVNLHGLKIARNPRGDYYVYDRVTKEKLIKGFRGTREQLDLQFRSPTFIAAYNRLRGESTIPGSGSQTFQRDTLGGLLQWFTCGDIDRYDDPEVRKGATKAEPDQDGYPKWLKLAPATRQDYLECYDWLRDAYSIDLKDIRQPDLYTLRDKCALAKWPRFADQMIAAISSSFKQAVRRGQMEFNPAIGMDKAHEADPNANREWTPEEWDAARMRAPREVLTCLVLARYAGLRGQTIVVTGWTHYHPHPLTGKAFQGLVSRKNRELNFLPAAPELQDYLSELLHNSVGGVDEEASRLIALRDNGTAWPSEKEMQTRVSHWLRDIERDGHIGAGTTLHGLRVSYAAWWKRNGAATLRSPICSATNRLEWALITQDTLSAKRTSPTRLSGSRGTERGEHAILETMFPEPLPRK
jgi:hypothetical protein